MGRSVLSWVCVFALGVVPLVGCGETAGTGGSGGSPGSGGAGGTGGTDGIACLSRICTGCDDANHCTRDACNPADGSCSHVGVCDDFNDCTTDVCNPANGSCSAATPVANGTSCAGGTCQSGGCLLSGSVLPCTEQGIRNAVTAGAGPYTFDCDGPTTVLLKGDLVLQRDLILDGEGNLTIEGGGVGVSEATTVELRGLIFTNGTGIGLWYGTLTIVDSAVLDSSESGISNILGALTVRDSTVSRSRRDGIVNAGTLTLTNSTVAGNSGSGITTSANRVGCSTTTIVGSTISENQGAGLSNCGELTITNSTISQNNDDGIINYGVGALTVANSTVTGGIHVESNDHPQDPQKVIVATATVLQGACTQSGDNVTWTSNGHNIESPGNTCGLDEAKGDQVNISAQDLKIGPLQDNGGPTMMHALLPGSVAIDVIPDEMCNVAEDQRGVARPQGDACDVGSFETVPCDLADACGDDSDPCTEEACIDGVCVYVPTCDDADDCTEDICDPVQGTCVIAQAEDGTLCGGGSCIGGGCEPIGSVFPCTELGIRSAIETGGGPYTFACDGPTTIAMGAKISIDNDVILDGEGDLEVKGNLYREPVISVRRQVTAELHGVAISACDYYGVLSRGNLTLTNSTVSGFLSNSGSLVLTSSTVTPTNPAYTVISNDASGTMTLTNATVSGSRATAILDRGTLTLTGSTVSGEPAIYSAGGDETLKNSLVIGGCGVEGGVITSNGYNIESADNTCGFDQATDEVNVSADDLKLGSLADNGGPTETHALLPGSVAIDVIPPDMCEVDEDQRGVTRPQGTMCDVGAFEVQEGSP